jgi:hypothetical protein
MKTRKTLAFLVVLAVGTGAGFGLKSVLADGIPSPNPLYYSRTLTEGSKLVNDTRAITINLWPDGTTQGSPGCNDGPSRVVSRAAMRTA